MNLGACQPLILASASTARAQMLANAGIPVRIEPAALDESEIKLAYRRNGETAASCAGALAEAKAVAVSRRQRHFLVIGADQILSCDGQWFDKPRDLGDARAQLRQLRGKRHELHTAAAVAMDGTLQWRRVEQAALTMRSFSDAFLEQYIAALGEELTKTVGCYALEGPGVRLLSKIEGDFFAILGLPLLALLDFLRDRGALR